MRSRLLMLVVCAALALACRGPASSQASGFEVTRETLPNGLQVVILRDPIAPVVSTMMSYGAGASDEPVAGLAHAEEHMMFRGSRTLSATQFAEVTGLIGGDFNAETKSEVTNYRFTAPAQDLDVVLQLEASRAQGLLNSQELWQQERGAIDAEVAQDEAS